MGCTTSGSAATSVTVKPSGGDSVRLHDSIRAAYDSSSPTRREESDEHRPPRPLGLSEPGLPRLRPAGPRQPAPPWLVGPGSAPPLLALCYLRPRLLRARQHPALWPAYPPEKL